MTSRKHPPRKAASHERKPKSFSREPPADLTIRLGNKVKQLRQAKQWSLDAMAAASGVSKSMLSQIERDQTNPTLAVSVRIAAALGISLGELIEHHGLTSNISVVRGDERSHLFRSDRNVCIRTLSPLHLEKDVEVYEVVLRPGGKLESAPHFRGTREFLSVIQGQITIVSGECDDRLDTGDSAYYRADVAHAISNVGRSKATLYLVVVYAQSM